MRIKPCPHCGGEGWLTQNYNEKADTYFVYVKCNVCGAQGKIYNSQQEASSANWNNTACKSAITAWNMRRKAYEEEEN